MYITFERFFFLNENPIKGVCIFMANINFSTELFFFLSLDKIATDDQIFTTERFEK